jgi:magnesium-protoporphyrin O-methyltransferase
MPTATYTERKGQLETYFDRTAVDAWARLTSDAPVGRIRATVRAGRDRMRATLLSWLPEDLSGRRILDAGCGTGALAVAGRAARRRGRRHRHLADARRSSPASGSPRPRGRFDQLPRRRHARPNARPLRPRGGDGLAHPLPRGDVTRVLAGLAGRTDHSIVFTFAPRTPALSAHARGREALPARRPRPGHRAGAVGRPRGARIGRENGLAGMAPGPLAADFQRLLHLAGPGARRAYEPVRPRHREGSGVGGAALPALRRRRQRPSCRSAGCCACRCSRSRWAWRPCCWSGTLNRVMIVELSVPAWLVGLMVSLPLLFAPFRALVGHRSDTHRSAFGWRRVPYIWYGTAVACSAALPSCRSRCSF